MCGTRIVALNFRVCWKLANQLSPVFRWAEQTHTFTFNDGMAMFAYPLSPIPASPIVSLQQPLLAKLYYLLSEQ